MTRIWAGYGLSVPGRDEDFSLLLSTSALRAIILLQNGTRGSFHGGKVAEV
jgi:hypothetical protein